VSFSFIQITDHHLRESESLLTFGYSTAYAFRAVLRHIAENNAMRADFIVTTGDLVHSGSDAEYQHVRQMLGMRKLSEPPGPQCVSVEGLREMPMYFLPGNHDPREAFLRNMFQPAALGGAPMLMNAAFTHKGMQFICLDWGADNKAVLYPAMLDFVRSQLAAGEPTIALMHHAVMPLGISRLDAFLPDEVGRFGDAIAGHNVQAIFCGHLHASYEARLAGIPVYGLRSTTFSFAADGDNLLYVLRPPHYRVVTVDRTTVSTEIIEVVI
jgi:hypothetical protein